jgi:hypothetical protein
MTQERAERVACSVGALGLAVAVLGWLLEPAVFPHAWLAALSSWIGWPLGCLALLLVHTLTGGRWGKTIRPQLLSGIGTLPLLLPALLPLMFVLPVLYPWWHPEVSLHLDNGFYLNRSFAITRTIIYLIAWYGVAAITTLTLRFGRVPSAVAVIGLLLLGLTASFAAIDATMSLDPHFSSSAYGMMAAAEGGLLALSVCVLLTTIGPPVPQDELNDLGRLLQGLLVLWAYLDFVQLLIVWQGDLPHEAPWYIERSSHGWGALAGMVAFGHFLLPFFVLVWSPLRRSRRVLCATALLLVLMEFMRAWWLVLPAGHRGFSWIDIAAMAAIWGFSAALALRGPMLRLAFAERGHG